ncbi:ArsR/SmtB family transcription factor [Candidatus Bipolaricaulota sp. J31]
MDDYSVQELARALSAMGSEERLRIISLLLKSPRVGCGELAEILGLSQPAVSYHLRVLETAALITKVREGRRRCISVSPKLRAILRDNVIRWLKEQGVS